MDEQPIEIEFRAVESGRICRIRVAEIISIDGQPYQEMDGDLQDVLLQLDDRLSTVERVILTHTEAQYNGSN